MSASKIHVCQCSHCQQEAFHQDKKLHHQMNLFLSRLDEQQRRWYVAMESNRIGKGGDRLLSQITGMDVKTMRRGRQELEADLAERPSERIRLPGGGQPPVEKKNPEIEATLEEMVTPETAGEPSSEQKWIRSSLRQLSRRLAQIGHPASPPTVSRLLKKLDYSLKANVKKDAGKDHPDRDKQFVYIQTQKQTFQDAGLPIISVDTKKKELIGNFKNAGQTWCKEAEVVNVHDFPQDAVGRAVPYGIYELNSNRGSVYVGASADTPQFAVDVITDWWQDEGEVNYPHADQLLILSDSGGSNSYRSRVWKQQIQDQLSDHFGLKVTVCHYPTGCSRWNPIEYRLFSHISLNWMGKPLRTFDTMLAYIRGTTTTTGLTVKASLVEGVYEKGQSVSDAEMKTLNLEGHETCPNWNYTIRPRLENGQDT